MSSLSLSNFQGRRIDLIGRVQGVALSSAYAGTSTLIFQTNDTAFRGRPIFVAFVTLDVAPPGFAPDYTAAATIPLGMEFDIGATGTNDWAGGTLDFSALDSGAIAYCGQMQAGAFPLPVYDAQVNFTVVNRAIATTSFLGQFSAYGWAD